MTAISIITEALINSTVHGIPRSITAQSRVMRVLWASLVLASCFAFGWHIRLLYGKYEQEPRVTKSNIRESRFEFPDIFLCPSTPVASSNVLMMDYNGYQFLHNEIPLSFKYRKSQNSLEIKSGFNASTINLIDRLIIYKETRPIIHYIKSWGHRYYQVFIAITVQGRKMNISRVKTVFDRKHTLCFKLSVSSKEMNYLNEEVELIVYGDNYSFKRMTTYIKRLNMYHVDAFGLILYFTETGSLPTYGSHSIRLRPGYFYDVKLNSIKSTSLNLTDRPCYEEKIEFNDPLNYNKTIKRLDVYRSCIDIRIQELFVESCKCYDTLITDRMIQPTIKQKYPSCFNKSELAPINETLLKENFNCAVQFRATLDRGEVLKYCKGRFRCTTHDYVPTWSFIKWPSQDGLDDSLYQLIDNTVLERNKMKMHLPGLFAILGRFKPLTIQEKDRAIRTTLTKIRIRPNVIYETDVTELFDYPLSNFVASIGGILGLYLGISLLTFFECIEVIYDLIIGLVYSIKFREYK